MEQVTPQFGGHSMRCCEVYEQTGIFKGEQMDVNGTLLWHMP